MHFVVSIQFSNTLPLSVVLFWEAEFNNHNLWKNKREWEVWNGKRFFWKKRSAKQIGFHYSQNLFPLQAEFDSNTTYCVYICVWMKDVMLFWKSWEISLRNVRGDIKKDVIHFNQMMRILSRNFEGFVCVSSADCHILFPHSFKESSSHTCGGGWRWWWRGHQYNAATYGKHYSKIKHQSEWKIPTSVLCNHIKSCKHARSVAWTGPDRGQQHQYVSTSLHYALVLLLLLLSLLVFHHFTRYHSC